MLSFPREKAVGTDDWLGMGKWVVGGGGGSSSSYFTEKTHASSPDVFRKPQTQTDGEWLPGKTGPPAEKWPPVKK